MQQLGWAGRCWGTATQYQYDCLPSLHKFEGWLQLIAEENRWDLQRDFNKHVDGIPYFAALLIAVGNEMAHVVRETNPGVRMDEMIKSVCESFQKTRPDVLRKDGA